MPQFKLTHEEENFLRLEKKKDLYWNNKNNSYINPYNYYHGKDNLIVGSSGTSMKLSFIGPSSDNVVVGHVSLWNSQK
jgi:hypothetical protein